MESLSAEENAIDSSPVPPHPVSSAERCDLVVLGGDSLAASAAIEAARLGARVQWFVGSSRDARARRAWKCWLAAARAAYQARSADRFGIHAADVHVDFARVVERTQSVLDGWERSKSLDSLHTLGISFHCDAAQFTDPHSLAAGERVVHFRRAILATGTRPASPAVSGLAEVGCHDRLTAPSMTELPARWIVLGGDATGCEFAQTLRRFGCEVQLVTEADGLLPREEPYAAELIRRQLEREGIKFHLGWKPLLAERLGDAKAVTIERQVERLKLFADEIFLAGNEVPDVETLQLESAGIKFDDRGISVDELLRTSNPAVFALGDACASDQIHAAAHARLAVRNALVWGRFRAGRWQAPRVIDTQPAIARIGLTRAAAAERGLAVESFRLELAEVERAVLDGASDGFAVMHVERGGDRIVGATIVADDAGALIGEVTLAVNRWLGLPALADSLHGELSSAELVSRLAANARPRRLAPQLAGWLKKWFAWRRGKTQEAAKL